MRVVPSMRSGAIDVIRVMKQRHARRALVRVRQAHAEREALHPRISAEVMLEAPVLLHDEHEVLGFLEAWWHDKWRSRAGTRRQPKPKCCRFYRLNADEFPLINEGHRPAEVLRLAT